MSGRRRPRANKNLAPNNTLRRDAAANPGEGLGRPLQPMPATLPPAQNDFTSEVRGPQPSSSKRMKVPIARLRREGVIPKTSADADSKRRVGHACEPCRQRKTRCSGETPVCKHCEEYNINCVYADGKRDRTRKEYNVMSKMVVTYQSLLQDISHRCNEADRAHIRQVLESERMPGGDQPSPAFYSDREIEDGEPSDIWAGGENRVTGRAGSTASLDRVNEDFNRSDDSRATGYIGKNSEVAWMHRLEQAGERSESDDSESGGRTSAPAPGQRIKSRNELESPPEQPRMSSNTLQDPERPISDSTYYCDDMPVSASDHVNPYELPLKAVADSLFATYIEHVHPAFPILGRTTFSSQYQRFFEDVSLNTGPNWLTILNLVFAIGAKYSHLTRAVWQGPGNNHIVYFTRARELGFNSETVFVHAELQRVQISGLTAFYLLATHQINRAYGLSGIAMRQAVTLGLNRRNESISLPSSSKEIRYRVWWALCAVERSLVVMTGRASSFAENDCSAPLPMPLEEEDFMSKAQFWESPAVASLRRLSTGESDFIDRSASPASSSQQQFHDQAVLPSDALFFLYYTKLVVLTHDAVNQLYRPQVLNQPWAQILSRILGLQSKVEKWRIKLPPVFDFSQRQTDQKFVRQRVHLGFAYYSAVLIINRPCLCRIDQRIPNQSGKAKDLNRSCATNCVHAATSMIGLLPNEPDISGACSTGPWWSLVHHLMQAAAIMMLELSFGAGDRPDRADEDLETVQKALNWLDGMSSNEIAAYRASQLCGDMLAKVVQKMGRDLPERPYKTMIFNVDSTMQDFSAPSRSLPGVTASAQSPYFGDYINYEQLQPQVSSWQPMIYTSYDNLDSFLNLPLMTQSQ